MYTRVTSIPDKHGRAKRVFEGSKRSILVANAVVHSFLPYRTLCRHSYKGALGIYLSTHDTDMCDYCDQWRNHDKACVQRITNELQEKLVYNCSALWDGWLAVAERQQAFRVEGFDASCSSLWYKKLAEYLASWKPPVDLAPDALEAINTLKGHWLEKFFCPEGWFATVEGIEAHIKLKNNQETAFWKDWENPENDTLYITLDGQEPNVIFVQSVRPAHRWRNA